jgi:hypothetical protein
MQNTSLSTEILACAKISAVQYLEPLQNAILEQIARMHKEQNSTSKGASDSTPSTANHARLQPSDPLPYYVVCHAV